MSNKQLIFPGIGTQWTIDFLDEQWPQDFEYISKLVQDRVELFESTYSRFRPDSLVSQMSTHTGQYDLPSDAQAMFSLYQQLYQLTSGAFTPLIGQTLVQAGYDADYSFESTNLTPIPDLHSVLTYANSRLTIHQPHQLDLGGLGKGRLVDIVAQLLLDSGFQSFCVDAGGDIFYRSVENKSLRVGLEHPHNPQQVIGVTEICNQALAASSSNRRNWGKFHHIINPHSLSSPNEILATWVLAEQTIIADGLATCLFLVPPEKLVNHFQFEYLILNQDFTITKSQAFSAEIFYNK